MGIKIGVECRADEQKAEPYGDLLHIFVDSAAVREESLRGALQRAGVEVIGLRLTRPRMEEAFVSIVRRQAAMERAGPEESNRCP